MVLRRAVGIALASVALIGATRESQAQPITVTNNGQPMAGAQVSAMINGIKNPLGTTDSTGQVTIDMNALNITKGTEVTVWIKTCDDGTVQVIMVPVGEDGECAQEGQQAGEDCGCRRAGTVIWGDGPITVDVGTSRVTQTTAGRGAAPTRSSWVVEFGFDARQMLNLDDVLAEVPGGSDESATSWAPGVQISTDWRFSKYASLGIEGAYSRMDTELRFPQGVQTADLDYYELGANAKAYLPGGRFQPYVTVSLDRTWNHGDFELDGLSDHRVHKTRRAGIGAGFDSYFSSNWGIRLEGRYSTTFEDHDADEHIRWKGALIWNPGGGGMTSLDNPGGLYE